MKGMRVQSIIRELRGEKIDIIEWSEDPVQFATHALSPAKISRVTVLDALGKHMEVIVDDSQLSLAIGKKGQNVRLAAKLLGWKIDIKSEEEKRQEVEFAIAALAQGSPVSILIDHGLSEQIADHLVSGGIGTVEGLGDMTPEQLEEIPGIDSEMIERIQMAVNSYYGQPYAAEQSESGESDEYGQSAESAEETGSEDSGAEPSEAGSGEEDGLAASASNETASGEFVTMSDTEGEGPQGAEGDVSGNDSHTTTPQV